LFLHFGVGLLRPGNTNTPLYDDALLQDCDYHDNFSVYLPLVAPVPPL
jgi:hypothetical protein